MEELVAERSRLEEMLLGVAAECDRARKNREAILLAYETTLKGVSAQHITFKSVSDEEFAQVLGGPLLCFCCLFTGPLLCIYRHFSAFASSLL
jgi:uncharacterized protein YllA (UPF0747 family)